MSDKSVVPSLRFRDIESHVDPPKEVTPRFVSMDETVDHTIDVIGDVVEETVEGWLYIIYHWFLSLMRKVGCYG